MEDPEKGIDIDRMLKAIRRKLQALHEGKIVSGELGLLKVGAEAAFDAEGMVNGGRLIEIRTDVYNNKRFESEISLHRVKGEEQFFVTKDNIRSLPTIPDAIEAVTEIRDRMNKGATYEEAVSDYKI